MIGTDVHKTQTSASSIAGHPCRQGASRANCTPRFESPRAHEICYRAMRIFKLLAYHRRRGDKDAARKITGVKFSFNSDSILQQCAPLF